MGSRAALIADHLQRRGSELDHARAAVVSLRRLLRAVPPTTLAAVEDDVDHDDVLAWCAHESRAPCSRARRPSCSPGQLGHALALCTAEETPGRVAVFTRRAGHRRRHT